LDSILVVEIINDIIENNFNLANNKIIKLKDKFVKAKLN